MTTTSAPILPGGAGADGASPSRISRWTVAVAVLAVLATFVPVSAVAVALTSIGAATGGRTSSLQWVSVSFVVPLAAVVMSAGAFAARYGLRRVLLVGLVLSATGGAAAASSSLVDPGRALSVLWTGQAVAGIGAGLLLPTTLRLAAASSSDAAQRDRHLGWWVSSSLVGLAVGPLLSASILEVAAYGWVFVPTAVLSLVLAVVAARVLPSAPAVRDHSLDWPGQVAAIIGIAATSVGVVELGRSGTAPLAVGLVLAGLLALAAFVAHERRAVNPLLDLSLLRVPLFAFAGTAAFAALFAGAGLLFLVSLFLGQVREFEPLEIGTTLLFVTAVPACLNPVAARVVSRVPAWPMLTACLAVASAGTFLVVGVDEGTSAAGIGWRLSIFGVGFASLLTAVPAVVLNAVRPDQAAMASTVTTAMRQLGGALGPAVLGSVLVAAARGGADPVQAFHTAVTVSGGLLAGLAVVGLVTSVATKGQRHAPVPPSRDGGRKS